MMIVRGLLLLVALLAPGCQSDSSEPEQEDQTSSTESEEGARQSSGGTDVRSSAGAPRSPGRGAGEPDFEGRYSYTGTNPDGSEYVGEWTIEFKRTGDTYQVVWTKPGAEPSLGIGILVDDQLVVGYDQAPGLPGIAVYTPRGDGTLSGIWSVVTEARTGTELLTPVE